MPLRLQCAKISNAIPAWSTPAQAPFQKDSLSAHPLQQSCLTSRLPATFKDGIALDCCLSQLFVTTKSRFGEKRFLLATLGNTRKKYGSASIQASTSYIGTRHRVTRPKKYHAPQEILSESNSR